jgi:hypothetical protein
MTRRSLVLPAAIVGATVVAAAVVLVAGGPDRGAVAMVLLVGVPLMLAIGGASDEASRTMPPPDGPEAAVHPGIRLVSFLPALLGQVAVLVVLVWQVVGSVAAGDAACAAALVPFALLAAWRGRQISRRLGGGR